MGLINLHWDGINEVSVPMRDLLKLWKKKSALKRRGSFVEGRDDWMKLQLSKMGKMNQKVISASLGR